MKKTDKRAFWLIPMAAWMTILYMIPLLIIIDTSFRTEDGSGFTMENYHRFMANAVYFKALRDSLWLSFRVVFIAFLIAFPASYIVCFVVPRKLRLFLLILMIIPFWTNYLIRAYSWITILGSKGLFNTFLMNIGLIDQPLELLYNELGTIIGLVHYITPMLIMFTYTAMDGINENLLEAACDMGASRLATIREIIAPLCSGGLLFGIIYVFIISYADFITPTTLGGQSILVLPQLVVDTAHWTIDWPMASVLAIVMTLAAAVVISLLYAIRMGTASLEHGGIGK